jgi:hypothetical protein
MSSNDNNDSNIRSKRVINRPQRYNSNVFDLMMKKKHAKRHQPIVEDCNEDLVEDENKYVDFNVVEGIEAMNDNSSSTEPAAADDDNKVEEVEENNNNNVAPAAKSANKKKRRNLVLEDEPADEVKNNNNNTNNINNNDVGLNENNQPEENKAPAAAPAISELEIIEIEAARKKREEELELKKKKQEDNKNNEIQLLQHVDESKQKKKKHNNYKIKDVAARLQNNPELNAHFKNNDNLLVCKYCLVRVTWEKISTIWDHVNSTAHQNKLKMKGNNVDVEEKLLEQPSIKYGIKQLDRKAQWEAEQKKFTHDFVLMMAKCNIPANKIIKLKDFFSQWLPMHRLPLRKDFPNLALDKHALLKDKLRVKIKDEPVTIVVDETTDRRSRSVVNVVVMHKLQFYLADTLFITVMDTEVLSQILIDFIKAYNIQYNNIDAIITDNATYNVSAFAGFKYVLPKTVHMRCWSHIIHLVGQAFIEHKTVHKISNIITHCQAFFCKSGKRKRRYLQFLKEIGTENPRIPPVFVANRWGSWFRSLKYWKQFLVALAHFLLKHKNDEEYAETINQKSPTFQYLLQTLCTTDLKVIIEELEFIYDKTLIIAELLDLLEKTKTPRIHLLSAYLDQVRVQLQTNKNPQLIEKFHEFVPAFEASFQKLQKYLECHPAMKMIKLAVVFDPRNLGALQSPEHRNLQKLAETFKFIDKSSRNYETLLLQWNVYWNTEHACHMKGFDIVNFWKGYPGKELASIALRALYIPVSAVDVERTFSKYRDIFTEQRQQLQPETIGSLLSLYMNPTVL